MPEENIRENRVIRTIAAFHVFARSRDNSSGKSATKDIHQSEFTEKATV
jgi:hypothetical protein